LVLLAAVAGTLWALRTVELELDVELDAGQPSGLTLLTSLPPLPSNSSGITEESSHDGSICDDAEEFFGGLCYKTCSLLSEGRYPIRTSSWTCCASHPCELGNTQGQVGKTILCNGYDVSGDGGCPHRPGHCLPNEENFMGFCYEQCSILTSGQFPNRVGVATCCGSEGVGCMDFRKDATSADFAVGGGAADADPSTPAERLGQ
jgi:hypothetical protein